MNIFLSKFYAVLGFFFISLMTANYCSAKSGVSGSINNDVTINVGIYAPFSSASAFVGRHMLGAMEIARDQLKSSDIHYQFYTLDKIKNNPNAARVLQKFIDTHHINVLVTEGPDSGALIAPIAKKNKLIHFCVTSDTEIADGKNNFLAQSPNHQRGAVLSHARKPEFISQFKKEYFSHPVTEAGYAFDIFQVLHNSAVLAIKNNSNFASPTIATHLLALESGTGVMGSFNLDKKGISYKKQSLTA